MSINRFSWICGGGETNPINSTPATGDDQAQKDAEAKAKAEAAAKAQAQAEADAKAAKEKADRLKANTADVAKYKNELESALNETTLASSDHTSLPSKVASSSYTNTSFKAHFSALAKIVESYSDVNTTFSTSVADDTAGTLTITLKLSKGSSDEMASETVVLKTTHWQSLSELETAEFNQAIEALGTDGTSRLNNAGLTIATRVNEIKAGYQLNSSNVSLATGKSFTSGYTYVVESFSANESKGNTSYSEEVTFLITGYQLQIGRDAKNKVVLDLAEERLGKFGKAKTNNIMLPSQLTDVFKEGYLLSDANTNLYSNYIFIDKGYNANVEYDVRYKILEAKALDDEASFNLKIAIEYKDASRIVEDFLLAGFDYSDNFAQTFYEKLRKENYSDDSVDKLNKRIVVPSELRWMLPQSLRITTSKIDPEKNPFLELDTENINNELDLSFYSSVLIETNNQNHEIYYVVNSESHDHTYFERSVNQFGGKFKTTIFL